MLPRYRSDARYSDTMEEPRGSVRSQAWAIGFTTGVYGISYGALAVAAGLSWTQASLLSLLMFTGASQFAMISVLGAAGNPAAAVASAGLLGSRNLFYGLRMKQLVRPSPVLTAPAAHLTIDESAAMAMAHEPPHIRNAFWSTGVAVFVLWNLGTLAGALGAQALGDPARWGLDAAVPAAFLALLWPQIVTRDLLAIAAAAAVFAIALTPLVEPGLPVLFAVIVPIVALRWRR